MEEPKSGSSEEDTDYDFLLNDADDTATSEEKSEEAGEPSEKDAPASLGEYQTMFSLGKDVEPEERLVDVREAIPSSEEVKEVLLFLFN